MVFSSSPLWSPLKYVLLLSLVIIDLSYSFVQYYRSPLDGDLAGGVVPARDVQQIFDDPFGFKVIAGIERHPNPNRYFAHLTLKEYFNRVPKALQTFVDPINSIYLAAAILKTCLHISILLFMGVLITGRFNLFRIDNLFIAVLSTPLLLSHGYYNQLGIIDKAITYVFFYALPIVLGIFTYLIYLSLKRAPFYMRSIKMVALVLLSIVLSFSGPLNAPIIAIVLLLICLKFLLNVRGILKFRLIIQKIQSFSLFDRALFLTLGVLTAYSLFLNTFNSTFLAEAIPISERYYRLPSGLYYWFTSKLGVPLILGLLILNWTILKKENKSNFRALSSQLKWFTLFAFIYLILLPLGGYRPYRPYLIRYDTMIPITLGLFYFITHSTYLVFQSKLRFKPLYSIIIIGFLTCFVQVEINYDNLNYREKKALRKIQDSEDDTVKIDSGVNALSWEPIETPSASFLNAQFLLKMNVTNKEKLYYCDSE